MRHRQTPCQYEVESSWMNAHALTFLTRYQVLVVRGVLTAVLLQEVTSYLTHGPSSPAPLANWTTTIINNAPLDISPYPYSCLLYQTQQWCDRPPWGQNQQRSPAIYHAAAAAAAILVVLALHGVIFFLKKTSRIRELRHHHFLYYLTPRFFFQIKKNKHR